MAGQLEDVTISASADSREGAYDAVERVEVPFENQFALAHERLLFDGKRWHLTQEIRHESVAAAADAF